MAESAIALQVQQPDAFKSIGSMLGIANQAQNIQRGNIDLQQNEIKLQERKGIQDLFGGDPKRFIKADGTPDYDAMIPAIMKAAPTTGAELVPKVIQGYKDSAAAQQTLNSLNGEQAVRVGNIIASTARLPPIEAFKLMDSVVGASPNLAPLFKAARAHLESVANDPAKFQALAMQLGQSVQSIAEQRAMTTPTGQQVTNNAQSGFMNMNPQAGPTGIVPGTQFNVQLPLGERQKIVPNAVTGTPQTETRDAFGNVQGVTQTPTGPGITTVTPVEKADLAILAPKREEINNVARAAADQRAFNREIIDLVPKSFTGAAADTWAKVFSIVDPTYKWKENSEAANYQKLNHFIALQSTASAKAMGAKTDQTNAMAEAAIGAKGNQAEATLNNIKFNDAMSTGLMRFNEGMEKAILNYPDKDKSILAIRDFQNNWTRAFDPDVYRYGNALEAKDTGTINAILGKPGTAERARKAKELAEKSGRLNQLVTEGK